MSTLEIILYSLLGVGFVIFLVITIVDYKKNKGVKKNKKIEDKQDLE